MKSPAITRTPTTLQIGFTLLVLAAVAVGALAFAVRIPRIALTTMGIVGGGIAVFIWLQRPVWAAYAALLLVLLPTGLIPPDLHSTLNRVVTVAAAVVWLFSILARDGRVRWNPTTILMLAFLGWSTLSLLWAENLDASTTILQAYVLRLALFLLIIPSQIRTKRDLDGFMTVLALSGWILMAASAVTVLREGYTPGTRLRVLGTNENELGMLALVTLTGVLWQAVQIQPRPRWMKQLGAGVFIAGTIGLVAASGSRGSALSLVAMLLTLVVLKPTRGWGALGWLLLALGAISLPVLFATTVERFTVVGGDTLLGGREALWQAAWQMIRDHPVAGVGIGNAPHALVPYLRSLRSVIGMEAAAIHNPVLTILAETGVLGVLLYLGVLGTAIWSFIRQYWHRQALTSPLPRAYFALGAAIFMGYMVTWIKGGGVESDHTYFLMLALLLIPSCLDAGEPERS